MGQVDYRRRISKPYVTKIEFTVGCNLRCSFCPTGHHPEYRDPALRRYMLPSVCETVAMQIAKLNPDGRIELTMRGEPLLSPHMLDNISIIRERMPKVQISLFTNGIVLFGRPTLLVDIVDAGVNILCIDCYGNTYDRFERLAKDVCPANDISVVAYYHDGFTPYKKHRRGYDMRRVCLIPDITEGVGTRVVHNMAGNVPSAGVPSVPLPKRCTRPFREVVVCHDGAYIVCCHDWSEELVYGNVLKEPLVDMWYGYDHWDVLCALYSRDRDFVPCDVCDFRGGYRVGLLQNPFVDAVGVG